MEQAQAPGAAAEGPGDGGRRATASRYALEAALPAYEIGDGLGTGLFGRVLRARHRVSGLPAVVTELPSDLAADPAVRRRFAEKAGVLAAARHPHLPRLYDHVEQDGCCLLVSEDLPRGTVWRHFEDHGASAETACAVAMATCLGLHHAHGLSVVHRAVRPGCLRFGVDGMLKVSELGLVEAVSGDRTLSTRRGSVVGAPAYMAPELAGGRRPGPAADIYATGVVLYQLLSGRLPYPDDPEGPGSDGQGGLAVLRRHLHDDPVPLAVVAPDVPDPLGYVTMRALAPRPEDRFGSAEEFAGAVAEAAGEALGPGWMARAEVAVAGSGPFDPDGASPGTAAADPARARPVAVSAPTARPFASETGGTGELVAVGDLLGDAPSILPALLAGAVLLLLAVAVARLGLGSPDRPTALAPGVVSVAGADVAGPGPVKVDLGVPVEIGVGRLPDAASAADGVQLRFSAGGAPLPASGVAFLGGSDGVRRVAVEASSAGLLAAGRLTGEVRLLAGDEVVATSTFAVDPSGSPWVTLPGVLGVALLVLALGFAAFLLCPAWAGRRRTVSAGLAALCGWALGVALVPVGWGLGAPEPRLTSVVVCAGAAAGAGVLASVAACRAAVRTLAGSPRR